jgi:hypothetical protein
MRRTLLAVAASLIVAAPAQAATVPLGNRTFDQAYDQVQPGDIIEVPAGSHPNQNITGTKSARVTFRAVGQVNVGHITVNADNVTLDGIDTNSTTVSNDTPADTINDVRVEGMHTKRMYIQNVRNYTVTDSEFGPNPGIILVMIGAWPESQNVTFERSYFHDNPPDSPEDHLECIFSTGIQGLTVRGSRFERCGYFGILNGMCCGAARNPSRLVFENNHFGPTMRWNNGGPEQSAPYSIMLGVPVNGQSRIVGNHFVTGPSVSGPFESLVACGNTGAGLNSGLAASWDLPCAGTLPASVCSNGLDDDLDGLTDFPADLGCISAIDDSEAPPDRDRDGVPDTTDACPQQAGPVGGCPDSDADGIADKDDACPTDHGTQPNGCDPPPDRDGDGFADGSDLCPDAVGQAPDGCPPPEPVYVPACAPTCDEQIATLTAERNQARSELTAARARADSLQAKLDRIAAILRE